jgi:hypothetical protein
VDAITDPLEPLPMKKFAALVRDRPVGRRDDREQGCRLVLKRREHRQQLVSADVEHPLPRSAPPTPAA